MSKFSHTGIIGGVLSLTVLMAFLYPSERVKFVDNANITFVILAALSCLWAWGVALRANKEDVNLTEETRARNQQAAVIAVSAALLVTVISLTARVVSNAIVWAGPGPR